MEDDSESKQSRILSFLANHNSLKSLSRSPWFCSKQKTTIEINNNNQSQNLKDKPGQNIASKNQNEYGASEIKKRRSIDDRQQYRNTFSSRARQSWQQKLRLYVKILPLRNE